MTATVTGLTGSPVTFTANASTVLSNFTIALNYLQTPTTAQKAAFDGAAARWSRVITGDLTDVVTNKAANACGVGDPALSNFLVDDLLIFVSLVGIDGVGKVLGQAGTLFHPDQQQADGHRDHEVRYRRPAQHGSQRDVERRDSARDGARARIREHLGRCDQELSRDAFVGLQSAASAAGQSLHGSAADLRHPFQRSDRHLRVQHSNGGSTYSGAKVPVENTCGPGTADSHWREVIFDNELMTGFISSTPNPMSRTTISSLQDLGYTVNVSEADPFTIPAPPPLMASVSRAGMNLQNDIRKGPIYLVDDQGRIVGLRIIR